MNKIFLSVLQFLPAIFGIIQHVEDTVKAPGVTKKAKAIDLTLTGLAVVNQVAAANVTSHPKFVAAVGKVNDAIVEAANVAAAIAAGTVK